MQQRFVPEKTALALAIAALFAAGTAQAQTQEQAGAGSDGSAATVVVTGTRVANRSALDTASPVDVISAETLRNTGATDLNQSLAVALPALNFPRPAITDGTDTVRPATLRGMGPDQSLVLVNSKRRHAASLVNLNGSIGRGASAVDLNTIPSAIVRSIEVLRDGAAAQYGSDAISGVINVRLRTDRNGGESTFTFGERKTDYSMLNGGAPTNATWGPGPTSRSRTDGQTRTLSAWKGLPWGETGYITIAGEVKSQEHTERSGYDLRQQYAPVNGAYDPREQTVNRYNAWYGEPEMKQKTLFVNAGNNLSGDVKVYGWSSYQLRDARSAGYFRPARDVRNVQAIYPDGFLPIIAPTVEDFSAAAGISWTVGAWDLDTSLVYGQNRMNYDVVNTLNASYGAASKTSFDAGGFTYNQLVYNLTGVRKFDVGNLASPLNLALGVEARREGYELHAGEPTSWNNGGVRVNGAAAASGAQVFPGFRPQNASDSSRTALGVFADLEANLTDKLLASAALRGERYNDFGSNLSGKLSGRYDFSKNLALRGAVQNGFRAPSLQQQNFTSTSTNFIDGIPYEITTFKPSDPVAVALGARPLKAEKSTNYSLGAVMRFDPVSITVDAYRINVRDRIVLSENLTSTEVRNYIVAQGFAGVGGGRFFINGVSTRSEGVDVVANLPWNAGAVGRFDFTLAGNVNRTKVTRVPTTAQLAALNPAPVLFDRINVLTLEEGQPKNKIVASANWKLAQWGVTARATRYGKVLSPGTTAVNDVTLDPHTIVDLEGRLALTKQLSLALGADNVFDQYSETLPFRVNTTNNAPFSNYTPFGNSGRYIYARANYTF